jgi:hypothetical protein
MRDEMVSACRWAWFLVRFYAVRLWRDLPGPWPVKVVLIVACVAIPGPFDEVALVALPRVCRAWRNRRHARESVLAGR